MKAAPTFGQTLRSAREGKQLPMREVAARAGISQAFLSKIESGKEKPPAEAKLRALAKVLDFDPDVLMALGGRLPADVVKIIQKHPREYIALLRELRSKSAKELEQVRGMVLHLARVESTPQDVKDFPQRAREFMEFFTARDSTPEGAIRLAKPAKVKFVKREQTVHGGDR